jgi:hypothetical protein
MTVFSCPVCNHILTVTPYTSAPNPVGGDSLKAKLADLKRRCTRGNGRVWDLVLAVAHRPQPCTLAELAGDLGTSAKVILSWRRILGRSCHPKRLNLSVIGRIGDKYQMASEDIRRIVLELG